MMKTDNPIPINRALLGFVVMMNHPSSFAIRPLKSRANFTLAANKDLIQHQNATAYLSVRPPPKKQKSTSIGTHYTLG